MTREEARSDSVDAEVLRREPQGPRPDATGTGVSSTTSSTWTTGGGSGLRALDVDTALLIAGALRAGPTSTERTRRRRKSAASPTSSTGASTGPGRPPEARRSPRLDARERIPAAPLAKGLQRSDPAVPAGAGLSEHPIPARSYAASTASYEWRELYGLEFLYAGPLFIHQLSHVWVDFRGIRDAYMRKRGIDYFENSRRATLAQQQYAIRNPLGFAGYGEFAWGITACEGPGPATMTIGGIERRFFDYVARGSPDGPDDGTLAPWAVVASLPFAPEIVLPTIRRIDEMGVGRNGPTASRPPSIRRFRRTLPIRADGCPRETSA